MTPNKVNSDFKLRTSERSAKRQKDKFAHGVDPRTKNASIFNNEIISLRKEEEELLAVKEAIQTRENRQRK